MARRTERAILDAAELLLRAGGYRGMTIQALADEADVAIGTIYGRFGGKEAVAVAVAERLLAANEAYLDRARRDDPVEEVRAFMEAYAGFHRDHPLAFRLLGDLQDPRIEARLEAMLDRLAAALRRAAAEGALREVPAKRTARVMWASANGLLALHARGGLSQRELRACMALQVDVLLAGLSPAAGPA